MKEGRKEGKSNRHFHLRLRVSVWLTEVLQVQCFMNIIILSELMKTYMFVVNPS